MDEQKTETRTYPKAELDAMSPETLNNLLTCAIKIRGTAIVRDRNGTIKYANPQLAGQYGEEHLGVV